MDRSFAQLNLSPEILRAIADQGYTEPTTDTARHSLILEGNDIMGAAQTGTGKTAGFTLPMLTGCSRRQHQRFARKTPIRSLICAHA